MEDDCRDGSDEVNCTLKPETGCKSTEFTCHDKRCIPVSWQCDGDRDCSDGSDETDCQSFSCSAWQFACISSKNKCIFRNWQCDGERDCDDGSDEANCTITTTTTTAPIPTTEKQCSELMFRCDNGHCIPFWWRCDELDDCGDASDEDGCPSHGFRSNTTTQRPTTTPMYHTCQKDQFQCRTGTCIWETWVCDNDSDCPDQEDEENCPQVKTCEDSSEYRCRRSSGCIPSNLLCDGHADCADGSDEEGCNPNSTPSNSCPDGYFMCDGGACLPLFKKCDSVHDCMDLSDEQNCTTGNDKVYSVTEIIVRNTTNVSIAVEWKINDPTTAPDSLTYLLSYTKKTAPGDNVVWKNMTWTSNTNYELRHLDPNTDYVLKVYIKEPGNRIFPPIKSQVVRTKHGIPTPPRDVKVEREKDVIKVSWKPPSMPNGDIKLYHIYVADPHPVFVTDPQQVFHRAGYLHEVMIPLSLMSPNASIWVTAENDMYISQESSHVLFHITTVDSELKVEVKNKTSSSVTLAWNTVKGVDGYIVCRDRPENVYLMGNVTANTSESSMQVKGLAPEMTYTFWVRPYEGNIFGPETTVRITTLGKKLLPVESLQAAVTKEGTTVKLSWTEPPYKSQKVSWKYRIVWGKSANDLKHSAHLATSPNTTFMIRGLDACETYYFAVMVGEPLGIGPVAEKQIQTGADTKAPPKNLQAKLNNMTMMITWEVCPQNSENYMLFITETSKNITSSYQLMNQKNSTWSHSVQVHWGGRYSIRVKTAVPDAVLSQPVLCNGPVIPAPYELTFNDGSFFWRNRNNESLPEEVTKDYTYILRLSEKKDWSDAVVHEVAKPPFVVDMDTLDVGMVYYADVALKDADGYLSERSQVLRIERPIDNEVVISQGSAVGVIVSVFLVVVALLVVVMVLAVRHRRLARSIITFTNTHYDSSQGTTLITTDHNLDEDDDSPMIRGFSDDEPLVIA